MNRVTDVKGNRTRLNKKIRSWDAAISDAKQRLAMAKERAQLLAKVVEDLIRIKESGLPWPGSKTAK
jgi:hypothetical protein